jgi:RNA 3'-terminal phosphate cyclase (ATP)
LPIEIARRETSRVIRKLNWDRTVEEHIEARAPKGPGNILSAELEYENITAMFCSFGERGVSAEKVADSLVRSVRNFLRNDAPVGVYLADQIMLPMAIAAAIHGSPCQFRTHTLSQHSLTHIAIIKTFLDVAVSVDEKAHGTVISFL